MSQINELRAYAAQDYLLSGENVCRAAGVGAPGLYNTHTAASIAADMLAGCEALWNWVSGFFD